MAVPFSTPQYGRRIRVDHLCTHDRFPHAGREWLVMEVVPNALDDDGMTVIVVEVGDVTLTRKSLVFERASASVEVLSS